MIDKLRDSFLFRFAVELFILAVIFCIFKFVLITPADPKYYEAIYDPNIALRELRSLNMPTPKWNIEKTYQITFPDGTPVMFNVTRFECCNGPIAMVKDGNLYFDYWNTAKAHPITATDTALMVDVPEFRMESILHELLHLVTLHHLKDGANPMLNTTQEKMAYSFESLYTQIKSLEEDGYFVLVK